MMIKKITLGFLILLIILTGCREQAITGNGPRIGITYGNIQCKLLRLGIDINEQYKTALQKYGAGIIMISVNDTDEDAGRKLSLCNGILIPGGYDIDPSRYGEKHDTRLEAVDTALDSLEFRVLAYARKMNIPVLGICRGEQMINVFYGGTLYQDIPSMLRSDNPVPHRNQVNLVFYKHATACYHDIVIEKGTLLNDLFGEKVISVNTYHHQAVKNTAPGFRVSARSVDGSVEAIENTGKQFVMGVQFHPEKMIDDNPSMHGIFRLFIEKLQTPAVN
ncbi:MAG: hypothetical protein CVV44_22415 [Spirochaetae bacterium HGW-Spirochaetae-1]|jgi:putative glutamine amidotransferase|nr:MAG: hypothetical protein CVV44_22415 [Spirochaetae bacterium HGW-Spirochaetae-1]